MSPAIQRGFKKAMRTAAQMITSGGLTALVNSIVHGLGPVAQLVVAAGWMYVVTFTQNSLETAGKIPVLLPTSGLVSTAGAAAPAVGTVEAVADSQTGEVTGTVTDTIGGVVGEVVGQLGYVDPEHPTVRTGGGISGVNPADLIGQPSDPPT